MRRYEVSFFKTDIDKFTIWVCNHYFKYFEYKYFFYLSIWGCVRGSAGVENLNIFGNKNIYFVEGDRVSRAAERKGLEPRIAKG